VKVGDLVKRRGKPWYALVVGFRDWHPQDCRYPEIVWLDGNDRYCNPLGVESCSHTLLEVVSSCPDLVEAAAETCRKDKKVVQYRHKEGKPHGKVCSAF